MEQAFCEYERHVKNNLQSYQEKYQDGRKAIQSSNLEDKLAFLRAYEKANHKRMDGSCAKRQRWTASLREFTARAGKPLSAQ
ncbi:MAG: hypothetical protein ACLT0Y_00335 [Christensenellales bacterium]